MRQTQSKVVGWLCLRRDPFYIFPVGMLLPILDLSPPVFAGRGGAHTRMEP